MADYLQLKHDIAQQLMKAINYLAYSYNRALRNLAAHEYANEDLTAYFHSLKKYTPHLLALKNQLITDSK